MRSALEFNQKSHCADDRRVAATDITRKQASIPLSKAGGERAQRKYEDKLILRSIRPSFIRRAKVRAAPSGLRRVAGVLVVPECPFPVMFVWFGGMSNAHHNGVPESPPHISGTRYTCRSGFVDHPGLHWSISLVLPYFNLQCRRLC